MAGGILISIGALAMSAEPSFARGGHGGGARQVHNGIDALIVTTTGPNGTYQQRVGVDNLPANYVPPANVRVVGHPPNAAHGGGGRNRGGRRAR